MFKKAVILNSVYYKFKYMFILNITMSFKTITIKGEVYKSLAKAKKRDESFSELFGRLLSERRPNLKAFYGAWTLGAGEAEKIEKELAKDRARMEKEFEERVARVAHESSR
jgi:predicted CopG family antitoxin